MSLKESFTGMSSPCTVQEGEGSVQRRCSRGEDLDGEGLIEDNVHELLVGLNARQRNGDNVATRVLRHGFNERGLASSRRAVKEEPEFVGEALYGVLAGLVLEVGEQLKEHLFLAEEETAEGL
jgi:hypothetical protein